MVLYPSTGIQIGCCITVQWYTDMVVNHSTVVQIGYCITVQWYRHGSESKYSGTDLVLYHSTVVQTW